MSSEEYSASVTSTFIAYPSPAPSLRAESASAVAATTSKEGGTGTSGGRTVPIGWPCRCSAMRFRMPGEAYSLVKARTFSR